MKYKLSVGYKGSVEDLKRVIDASNKVKSVYTGGIAGVLGGGRYQYSESFSQLAAHVRCAHERNVALLVTVNAPCGIPMKSEQSWWQRVEQYFRDIEATGANGVVISHPFLIELAKSKTELVVVASTICEISTARQALYYESMGADVIVPSVNLNMQLSELRLMKRTLNRATLKLPGQ